MASTKKVQHPNRKLISTVMGGTITLSLSSFGISAQSVLAAQSGAFKSVPQADGTYLYGETPQPNKIGFDYVVFQRQNGKVIGAIYSPSSELECFTGGQQNNTLNVLSVGSEPQEIASVQVKLSNLHPIRSISANEQRILNVCKTATVSLSNR